MIDAASKAEREASGRLLGAFGGRAEKEERAWKLLPRRKECLERKAVAWIHVGRQMLLTIHKHVIVKIPRFSVSHDNQKTWLLHINSVQQEDRGYYMCQVNTNPMMSQVGFLQVVVPPNILDGESTESTVAVRENQNVTLTCKAVGYPTPTLMWKREDGQGISINRHHKAAPPPSSVVNATKSEKTTGILLRTPILLAQCNYQFAGPRGTTASAGEYPDAKGGLAVRRGGGEGEGAEGFIRGKLSPPSAAGAPPRAARPSISRRTQPLTHLHPLRTPPNAGLTANPASATRAVGIMRTHATSVKYAPDTKDAPTGRPTRVSSIRVEFLPPNEMLALDAKCEMLEEIANTGVGLAESERDSCTKGRSDVSIKIAYAYRSAVPSDMD
ncbi:hypothetical protein KM043_003942 [Ampulex compressa]|nr:hypothetical protein KM043_003942 [Ampulex compressa]